MGKITHAHCSRKQKDRAKLRTYQIWSGIKQRCRNPKNMGYYRYGAVGITMCDRWFNSFEAFLEDMGERPGLLTVDRLDGTKGYEPGNCRWATKIQQAQNTRSNVKITFGSATRSLSYWCHMFHMPHATASSRIKKDKMLPQVALTLPWRKSKEIQVGDKFGGLTVVELLHFKNWEGAQKTRIIRCICVCGKDHLTTNQRLKFKNAVRCTSCAGKIARAKQLKRISSLSTQPQEQTQ